MARASGEEDEPDTRAGSLLPLDEYHRIGGSRNVRWSPLRADVLALLWKSREPWGAYGIAERLSRAGERVHPNSIYRCLKRLEAAGLVIPVVTWNRYVISPDPRASGWGVILCATCRKCEVVAMPEEHRRLRRAARSAAFRPTWATIEYVAKCSSCRRPALDKYRCSGVGPP